MDENKFLNDNLERFAKDVHICMEPVTNKDSLDKAIRDIAKSATLNHLSTAVELDFIEKDKKYITTKDFAFDIQDVKNQLKEEVLKKTFERYIDDLSQYSPFGKKEESFYSLNSFLETLEKEKSNIKDKQLLTSLELFSIGTKQGSVEHITDMKDKVNLLLEKNKDFDPKIVKVFLDKEAIHFFGEKIESSTYDPETKKYTATEQDGRRIGFNLKKDDHIPHSIQKENGK